MSDSLIVYTSPLKVAGEPRGGATVGKHAHSDSRARLYGLAGYRGFKKKWRVLATILTVFADAFWVAGGSNNDFLNDVWSLKLTEGWTDNSFFSVEDAQYLSILALEALR